MKKLVCKLLCFLLVFMALVGNNVENYYADAGVSLSLSATTVQVGDEVTVTISIPNDYSVTVDLVFPADVLTYKEASVSSSNIGTTQVSQGRINLNLSDIFNLTSVTLTFKAEVAGSGAVTAEIIKAGNNLTEEVENWSNVTKNITVEKKVETTTPSESPEPQKSDDNSLTALKLSSGSTAISLSPAFKGNVVKYTATVSYDVKEVTVAATKSSAKAEIVSVTGNGSPVKLNVGTNTIEVKVKAENGTVATYTITITRKAQETAVQPSESESSETETVTPEINDALKWDGEQLYPVKNIPAESIPTDFESRLLVVNGEQMQGLSFLRGPLTVLYLNNNNGAGALYVYDDEQQAIYPFIKLSAERTYVMVLMPDEASVSVPEGYVSCTVSIEGKGVISAYRLATNERAMAQESEFYLVYCMNNDGETGWYQYDIVEGTFQRYFAGADSVQTGGAASDDSDLQEKYAALEQELETAKLIQYIAIAITLVVVVILLVLLLKNKKTVDEDDEIEVEFYHMEEAIVKETLAQEQKAPVVEAEKDDGDLEFIDFE